MSIYPCPALSTLSQTRTPSRPPLRTSSDSADGHVITRFAIEGYCVLGRPCGVSICVPEQNIVEYDQATYVLAHTWLKIFTFVYVRGGLLNATLEATSSCENLIVQVQVKTATQLSPLRLGGIGVDQTPVAC